MSILESRGAKVSTAPRAVKAGCCAPVPDGDLGTDARLAALRAGTLKHCRRCGSSRVIRVSLQTWRCEACGKKMRTAALRAMDGIDCEGLAPELVSDLDGVSRNTGTRSGRGSPR